MAALCKSLSRTSLRVFPALVTARRSSRQVKAYQDLPTAHILPDGNPAQPLPEWHSGPDREPAKTGVAKPRRGRKPRSQVLVSVKTENEVDSQTSSSIQIQTEPNAPRLEDSVTIKRKMARSNGQQQNNLIKEIQENLSKFPGCLLLTRVGQFYESYFDQANEISRLLGIKLTSRKWNGTRIAMCGFPLMHLDKHLKVLVQQKKRFVAMCEEFPRISDRGSKIFDRRVVRIITPGTLIDESFLNPSCNNYLLSISIPESTSPRDILGLAWIDISTGEFFSKTSTLDSLRDELARIAPSEVVLDEKIQSIKFHPIFQILAEEDHFVSFTNSPLQTDEATGSSFLKFFAGPTLHEAQQESTHSSLCTQERAATYLLSEYLHKNLLEYTPCLPSPSREGVESRMEIDSHTLKALEIREGMKGDGTRGTLLNTIKRTITTGGTRLLTRWLCSPSTSVAQITARQSLVSLFCERPHFREDLLGILGNMEDVGRIVQKLILGRGVVGDLLALKRTIHLWTTFIRRIDEEHQMESVEDANFKSTDWDNINELKARMADLRGLLTRINLAVEDTSDAFSTDDRPEDRSSETDTDDADNMITPNLEPSVFERYGKWAIKPGFSSRLTNLHNSLQNLLNQREKMERDLQLKYDAPSLTLRHSPGQGMHVHLARAKRDQAKLNASPEFISLAESGSTRCYFYKDWVLLGGQIVETESTLSAAEKEAFGILRDEVISHSPLIKRNARILDELDVALAFSSLADELNFVRPVIVDDPTYAVKNGRHPSVELGLLGAGRLFTPNSLELSPTSRLHVITGPNMAGKSTFLRQTALIAILAQIGSFVPADQATIGIVDKLFSRVGAKDDLFHDRSTFMVEMLETAEILRRATPRSLVIMDEVGRGTTVVDGLAIAYATIHHLVTTNQCRTLFATHFHELSDLIRYPEQKACTDDTFRCVDFFCTDVAETVDDHFAYQYRVSPGVNRESHGLKVAQIAGMPLQAMTIARKTLQLLKTQGLDSRLL